MELIITRPNAPEEILIVDATLRESPEDTAVLATRPLERGAKVTDHIQVQPPTLSADIFFSDSPIEPLLSNTPAGWSITPQVVVVEGQQATLQVPTGPVDHVSNVYQRLLAMMQDGALSEVTTSLRRYTNMVCTRVSAPRQTGDGDGVIFTVDWEQIRFATTKTVPITEKPRHQPKKPPAPEATTDVADIKAQKDFASGLGDSIGALF